ncbi:MAG TPA: lysozyme inhibitor LprI family protein [Allosphingosinicella sp.]
MTRLVLLLLLAASSPALASPQSETDAAVEAAYSSEHRRCLDASGGGDVAMIECNGAEFSRQDAALNAAYRALLARLPKAEASRIRTSQRTWLRAGKTVCDRSIGTPFRSWGTLERLRWSNCNLDRTIRRTVLLERYRAGRATLRDLNR